MSWISPIVDRVSTDISGLATSADNIRENKVKTFQPLNIGEEITLKKGMLTIDTLNRIENNQQELKSILNSCGYGNINIMSNSWSNSDILYKEDWQQILINDEILRTSFFAYSTTPQTSNEKLNYTNLNAVEQILKDLHDMASSMINNYRLCNTFKCGE